MHRRSCTAIITAIPLALMFVSAALCTVSEEFHKTYTIPAGSPVTVRNKSGTTSVSTWDQQVIDVRAVRHANKKNVGCGRSFLVVNTRKGLEIRTDACDHSERPSFWESLFNMHSYRDDRVDISIRLPRGSRLGEVLSESGDIIIDTVHVSGSLRSSSGDIHMEGVLGNCTVATESGNITAERCALMNVKSESGDIHLLETSVIRDVHSESGNILIERTTGELSAESESGDIRISTGIAGYPLMIGSESGDIILSLPASVNTDISLATSSGTIDNRSDLALRAISFSERSISGKIGSGGPRIQIKTESGNITLDK